MAASRGTEINGRYRLTEPVGRGGMATVWKAWDLRLGRDVAIKVIAVARLTEPGFVERFEREAQIAARLSHPNLVSIHDLGFHEGRPYLVMEFIEGETLSRRLDRAPETVDEVELARTLLGVLAAIHDKGIVHRDVKPANVLFQDDGRIRLTDFGIARIIGSSSITQTNEVIGTLEYMAPEVRDGTPPSPAADLYALGVLLGECGASDGPLRNLVRKLRASDPAQRPASARLALISIAGIESSPAEQPARLRAPTEVLREQPPDRASRTPSPRTLGFIGGFVAVLAAVAIIASLLGTDDGGGGGESERASSESATANERTSEQAGQGTSTEPAPAPATDTTESPEPAAAESAGATVDPAQGAALNEQGYELLQAGNAEEAVPILQQAVASWPEGSEDINYAYALYNLGVALRQSGDPEQAIPYLEQRLAWNDQRETVKAELQAARAEAG